MNDIFYNLLRAWNEKINLVSKNTLDKAFAVLEVVNYLKIKKDDVLFIGDAIYENGNDFPVAKIGINTVKVSDPNETKLKIKDIILS